MNTKTKAYISINNQLSEVKDIILGPDKRVVLLQRGVQILYNKLPTFSVESSGENVTGLVNKSIKYGDYLKCRLIPDVGYAISSVTVTMGGIDITQEVYSPYQTRQSNNTSSNLLGQNNDNGNEPNDNEQDNG